MRFLVLLFLCLSARAASWQSSIPFYWYNDTHPGVALSSSNISGIFHASGSVSAVQVGDQNGINAGLCTGFISDGVCGGSVQNCQWGLRYRNVTNDSFLFFTCRAINTQPSYVATNVAVGAPVTWFSLADRTWYNGVVTINDEPTSGFLYTFPDGETGWFYTMTFTAGGGPTGGNSGSPVFTVNGDYIGSAAYVDGGNLVALALYPSGAQHRPPSSPATAGLASLFNSDPDR